MPTQAAPPPALFATVQVEAARAGKIIVKLASLKDGLTRVQVSFPPISAAAAQENFLARMAPPEAAEPGGRMPPEPRFVSVRAALAEQIRVAAVTPPAAPVAAPPTAIPAGGDAEFRARIALLESGREPGMGYGARNVASGALGRYQFTIAALRDIGWRDARGGWTAEAVQQGVAGEVEFLGNPAAQEAAMGHYIDRKAAQLSANGALAAAGAVLIGTDGLAVPITEAGLVAAAHRQGASSVARWLEHCRRTPEMPLDETLRIAFVNVEQRLRGFADLPYALPMAGVTDLERARPSS